MNNFRVRLGILLSCFKLGNPSTYRNKLYKRGQIFKFYQWEDDSMMYVGEKVRLREYRKDDIPLRLSYINDPEMQKYLVADTPYPMTLREEENGLNLSQP